MSSLLYHSNNCFVYFLLLVLDPSIWVFPNLFLGQLCQIPCPQQITLWCTLHTNAVQHRTCSMLILTNVLSHFWAWTDPPMRNAGPEHPLATVNIYILYFLKCRKISSRVWIFDHLSICFRKWNLEETVLWKEEILNFLPKPKIICHSFQYNLL